MPVARLNSLASDTSFTSLPCSSSRRKKALAALLDTVSTKFRRLCERVTVVYRSLRCVPTAGCEVASEEEDAARTNLDEQCQLSARQVLYFVYIDLIELAVGATEVECVSVSYLIT